MVQKTKTTQGKQFIYSFARGAAVSAFFFILLISCLLVLNWFQLTLSKPTEAPALVDLYNRYRDNPGDNALKEEIRIIDLMLRKAYFTKQWQVATGGYILFGAVAVFTAALILMEKMKKTLPVPAEEHGIDTLLKTRSLTRWLAGMIVPLLALPALVIAFTTGAMAEPSSFLETPTKGTGARLSAAEKGKNTDLAAYKKNWPGFRGAGGNGFVETGTAPVSWDGISGAGILWKSPLPGKGFNSPVIWDKYLFLSGGDEKKLEVYCYHTDTGELRWQKTVKELAAAEKLEEVTDDTGYAAPTMATDGERAVALFATGDIAAFDFNGNLLWSRNLGKPEINYGHASSPLIFDNQLFVQYDHPAKPRLLVLEPATGKTLKEIPRDVSSSWASPVIGNLEKNPVLLLTANPYVTAYDIPSHTLLWSTECMNGEVAPSLACSGDKVFAANQFAILAALDLKTGSLLWEFDGELPNVSSPAANRDFLFLATSYGFLSCVETATGELLWTEEFPEGFYSSPVIIGSTVYLMDMTGTMYLFKASREYEHIAHCVLGENSVCTPAFADNRIYIRGEANLYCIGGTD